MRLKKLRSRFLISSWWLSLNYATCPMRVVSESLAKGCLEVNPIWWATAGMWLIPPFHPSLSHPTSSKPLSEGSSHNSSDLLSHWLGLWRRRSDCQSPLWRSILSKQRSNPYGACLDKWNSHVWVALSFREMISKALTLSHLPSCKLGACIRLSFGELR